MTAGKSTLPLNSNHDDEATLQIQVDSKFTAFNQLIEADSKFAALSELVTVVSLLHFRMQTTARELHQEGEFSAGRRSLLANLKFDGPATVPHLARIRPVSRQFIQKLTNELAAEGLVEFVNNPEHKRSKLLRITPLGERMLADMLEREAKLGVWLAQNLEESDIRTAARVVSTLRDKLTQSADWQAENRDDRDS